MLVSQRPMKQAIDELPVAAQGAATAARRFRRGTSGRTVRQGHASTVARVYSVREAARHRVWVNNNEHPTASVAPPKFVLCVQTSKSVTPKFVRFVQTSRSATPEFVRFVQTSRSATPKFVRFVQTSRSATPKLVRFVQTSRSATPRFVLFVQASAFVAADRGIRL